MGVGMRPTGYLDCGTSEHLKFGIIILHRTAQGGPRRSDTALLVKQEDYRAPGRSQSVILANLSSSAMESVEGGCGATVGERGPEESDIPIVPGARIYDLVPVRELPAGPQLHRCNRDRTDDVPHLFKNRLHLAGRPQMSTRPS
jgi:hypothetical protein